MIENVAATGSTNADLVARLASGNIVPEGHWLIADRQLAGRGRQGRTWFDGIGNFMGSTTVKRRAGDPAAASLALLAGLAVHETIAPFIPPPRRAVLKWPNDVMIGAAKLAGILLEASEDDIIVGIGVNLAAAPELPDRQTIALAALGPAPDRDGFASALARCFAIELDRWRTFGLEPMIRRWLAAAHPAGTPLHVGEPGEPSLLGTFAGLTSDGALQLRLPDATTRIVHAGEVRLAPATQGNK